jgi:hypothetical protein
MPIARTRPGTRRPIGCLGSAAKSGASWVIPWPRIHEFRAIVTHPRIYDPPTRLATRSSR